MKARFIAALAVLTASPSAFGQEVAASTAGPAPAGAMVAPADGFAAPNGQYGAGLSISGVKTARAYGELGIYSVSFGADSLWSFSAIAGGGYKLQPELELEAMLPLGLVLVSDETGAAVGNLHLGANYVGANDKLRFKVGGALQWAPWTIDASGNFLGALIYSAQARSLHDIGLWAPETLSIVAPARVEFGDQVVPGVDAQLGVHIPTDGGDVDVTIQLDPGVGYYVNETVLIGGRLPIAFIPTSEGDNAQVAIEPYGRFDLGTAFLNARFTLNIDEPLGFGFDEGRIWAIHLGGGGTF